MEEPMGDTKPEPQVNDADVQAIIDQGEAGVADLMAAYEPYEQTYFAAVRSDTVGVTYSIDTTRR
jgi:hypothetical protein